MSQDDETTGAPEAWQRDREHLGTTADMSRMASALDESAERRALYDDLLKLATAVADGWPEPGQPVALAIFTAAIQQNARHLLARAQQLPPFINRKAGEP